jgi:hypothetical protein
MASPTSNGIGAGNAQRQLDKPRSVGSEDYPKQASASVLHTKPETGSFAWAFSPTTDLFVIAGGDSREKHGMGTRVAAGIGGGVIMIPNAAGAILIGIGHGIVDFFD